MYIVASGIVQRAFQEHYEFREIIKCQETWKRKHFLASQQFQISQQAFSEQAPPFADVPALVHECLKLMKHLRSNT
jgi:hypothetical protein